MLNKTCLSFWDSINPFHLKNGTQSPIQAIFYKKLIRPLIIITLYFILISLFLLLYTLHENQNLSLLLACLTPPFFFLLVFIGISFHFSKELCQALLETTITIQNLRTDHKRPYAPISSDRHDSLRPLVATLNTLLDTLKVNHKNTIREKRSLENYLSHIPGNHIIWTPNKELLWANPKAEKQFSFTKKSPTAQALLHHLYKQTYYTLIKTPQAGDISKFTYMTGDYNASLQSFILHSQLIKKHTPMSDAIITSIHPQIDDPHTQKIEATFLKTISHELRTPLTSIIGFTELLQSELQGSLKDRQIDLLSTILKSSMDLNTRINHLVLLSHLKEIPSLIKYTHINITNFFNNYSHGSETISIPSHVNIQMKNLPETIEGDIKLLRRLIDTILSVCEATPQKEPITIKVSNHHTNLKIEISSLGIIFQDLDINQPFSIQSKRKSPTCMGVAFSLIQKLTQLQHGSLALSKNIERYNSLTIYIPNQEKTANRHPICEQNQI